MLPQPGMSVIALGYKPTLACVPVFATACLCGMDGSPTGGKNPFLGHLRFMGTKGSQIFPGRQVVRIEFERIFKAITGLFRLVEV
jgi:hypothetical protein